KTIFKMPKVDLATRDSRTVCLLDSRTGRTINCSYRQSGIHETMPWLNPNPLIFFNRGRDSFVTYDQAGGAMSEFPLDDNPVYDTKIPLISGAPPATTRDLVFSKPGKRATHVDHVSPRHSSLSIWDVARREEVQQWNHVWFD